MEEKDQRTCKPSSCMVWIHNNHSPILSLCKIVLAKLQYYNKGFNFTAISLLLMRGRERIYKNTFRRICGGLSSILGSCKRRKNKDTCNNKESENTKSSSSWWRWRSSSHELSFSGSQPTGAYVDMKSLRINSKRRMKEHLSGICIIIKSSKIVYEMSPVMMLKGDEKPSKLSNFYWTHFEKAASQVDGRVENFRVWLVWKL